jgi:hypothetical protein
MGMMSHDLRAGPNASNYLQVFFEKDKKHLMRKIFVFALVLSCFYLLWLNSSQKQALSYNVIGCQILDNDGTVLWSLPGGMRCIFYEDGSLVAAINNELVRYDKNLNLLWRKDIFNHHQLNRSGNKILVMSDEHILENNDLVRYDVLHILDLSGNILNTFRVSQFKNSWYPKSEKMYWTLSAPYKKNNYFVRKEFSHFNSFYSLPKNLVEKIDPTFAEGNYIISDCRGKIFILDKNLRDVVWEISTVDGMSLRTHDAQFTAQGKIVYYYNNAWGKQNYTTLDEIDPLTRKRSILFREDPPELFFSMVKGGLQFLENGNILTSDNSYPPRAFEFDPKTQQIVWIYQPKELIEIQQIKRYDLKDFLLNNSGI